MRSIALSLALSLCSLIGAAKAAADRPEFIDPPEPPHTVEALRSWHAVLGQWPWHYLPEQEVRLRRNGPAQLLICSEGGARNGEFMLFKRTGDGWHPIGAISQSHHPIRVLPISREGWHDFETFSPLWGSGGNEVFVARYRWTGNVYQRHSSTQGRFCDFEPFKSSLEFAQSCR